MHARLIKGWKRFDEYKGWALEKAVTVEENPYAPDWCRARKGAYTFYAPDDMPKNAAVLTLMQEIRIFEMTYGGLFKKERTKLHFNDYDEALEYAQRKLTYGFKTTRLYVKGDRWLFSYKHGKVMGAIIERNVL